MLVEKQNSHAIKMPSLSLNPAYGAVKRSLRKMSNDEIQSIGDGEQE